MLADLCCDICAWGARICDNAGYGWIRDIARMLAVVVFSALFVMCLPLCWPNWGIGTRLRATDRF